jgi:valyl-tRNA synthetase
MMGGGDINFDIKVMHAYRRFCNKIWQPSTYVLGRLPDDFVPYVQLDFSQASLSEQWILHRPNVATRGVNEALEAKEFSKCTHILHQFFYDELCDVFIENSKALLSGTPEEQSTVFNTLYTCLGVSLRLLHPFLPFITEELWQRLPSNPAYANIPSIMLAPYSQPSRVLDFSSQAEQYGLVLGCAKAARSLTVEYQFRSGARIFIHPSDAATLDIISPQIVSIRALSGKAVERMDVVHLGSGDNQASASAMAIFTVSPTLNVLLGVSEKVTDIDDEVKKLEAKLAKTQSLVRRKEEVLAQPGFAERVSDAVKAGEARKLEEARSTARNYTSTIERLRR